MFHMKFDFNRLSGFRQKKDDDWMLDDSLKKGADNLWGK